jgi:hypothetical protein
MPKPIQLHIPTPCHENWATMQPAEKGRHCAACQKTVIDFTGMSDAQLIHYFSQPNQPSVCGRLAPDQLHRNLLPPPARNGWHGWHWLLAGLLFTSDDSTPRPPAGPPSEQHQTQNSPEIINGEIVPAPLKRSQPRKLKRENNLSIGTLAIIIPDSSWQPQAHLPNKVTPLRTAQEDSLVAYTGGIAVATEPKIDTLTQIKEILTDTLRAIGLLPKNELKLYPNPAPSGATIHLEWNLHPGTYQGTLFTIAGNLIQARTFELTGAGQTDHWQLPTTMAAGIYILKITQPDGKRSVTRKLVIQK